MGGGRDEHAGEREPATAGGEGDQEPSASARPSRNGKVPAVTARGTSRANATAGPVEIAGHRRRAENAAAAPAQEPTTTVGAPSSAASG